jgi:DNA invertase Pin-like site-specific DNA recombinase
MSHWSDDQAVALYARVSTEKAQTVENQLLELQEVAVRLGWTVVAVCLLCSPQVMGRQGSPSAMRTRPRYRSLIRPPSLNG